MGILAIAKMKPEMIKIGMQIRYIRELLTN